MGLPRAGLSAAALIDMGEPAPQAALHVALYSQVHVSVALELFAVARPGKILSDGGGPSGRDAAGRWDRRPRMCRERPADATLIT